MGFYLEILEREGIALEDDPSSTRQAAIEGREYRILETRYEGGGNQYSVEISMVQLPDGSSQVMGSWAMDVDSSAIENRQAVNELLWTLENGDATEQKEAVISLGEMGPAASEALPTLFFAMARRSVFEGAFEGSFVDELATAIAAIAEGDAVSRCEPLFDLEGDSDAFTYTPFCVMLVLPRVGEGAVPGLAEISVTREVTAVRRSAVLALKTMAEGCVLGAAEQLAENALRIAASHDPDDRIRTQAQDALAHIAVCRR
ncbi:hypothetical protein ACGF5M_03360 [Gemmatimonadota bacterium]